MSLTRIFSSFAFAAAIGAPLVAGAQTLASPAPATSAAPMPGRHHGHHHHRASLMHSLQTLNLTDAQKQQVATFRSQQRQADQNADPATKRTNAAKMRDQIMGILTPDQKTQLRAQMHRGSAMGPNSPSAPAPAASPNSR